MAHPMHQRWTVAQRNRQLERQIDTIRDRASRAFAQLAMTRAAGLSPELMRAAIACAMDELRRALRETSPPRRAP